MSKIPERKDTTPGEGASKYGDVKYADPTNKKYPIDTEEHIRAAWNYINHPANAAKYDHAALMTIKGHIVAAWKRVIDKEGPPSAMMADTSAAGDVLRKRMPLCMAVGEFDNGPGGSGTLDVGYFEKLVASQKKQPRQIPIYNLVGKPDPEHPEDLDQWEPDGWVENFSIEGGRLMGDCKLIGAAADMVRADKIRGASIGTVDALAYDGTPLGPALAHVVLTNKPFVKGMNIAATRAKGGEAIAYHFTALLEAAMAEKKEPDAQATAEGDGEVNLTDKLEAKEVLLAQANGRIKDLEAQNANLLEEVKAAKEAPDLALANKRIRQLERHNKAEKVRRLTAAMVRDRQINTEVVRGWYDHDSDEVVLAGFESSQFKGEMALAEYHRASVPKNPSRTFASGADATGDAVALTAEEQAEVKAIGKDPVQIAAVRGAKTFTEWKERRKAAGKE